MWLLGSGNPSPDRASRKSAQLPPLLANIYKAVEVRLPAGPFVGQQFGGQGGLEVVATPLPTA